VPSQGCASSNLDEEDGPLVFHHACKLGLEGIVSKRREGQHFVQRWAARTLTTLDFPEFGNDAAKPASGSAALTSLGMQGVGIPILPAWPDAALHSLLTLTGR
jgi:hypothetical protein